MTVASERPQALRRLPLFAGADDASMKHLLVCVRWKTLSTGETLYKEGEAGDTMAIILEGSVVAKSKLKRGGEFELERASVGAMVGEMVCIDPAPRSATVTALQPTVVGEIGRDALMGLRRGAPKVYALLMRQVISVVSRRLREIDNRIDAELAPPAPAPKKAAPARPEPARAPARKASDAGGEGFRGFLDRLLGKK